MNLNQVTLPVNNMPEATAFYLYPSPLKLQCCWLLSLTPIT